MRRDPADGRRIADACARSRTAASRVGFSLLRTVADEAELLLLAVVPSHHRRGIGTRLLDEFIDRARDDGCDRVHLEVRDGNPAVAMYERAGFAPSAGAANIIMRRDGEPFRRADARLSNFSICHFISDTLLALLRN